MRSHKCRLNHLLLLTLSLTIVIFTTSSECARRNKSRDFSQVPNTSNDTSETSEMRSGVRRSSSKFSANIHLPLLPLSPQDREVIAAAKTTTTTSTKTSRRRSRDQIAVNNSTGKSSTGKSGQAKQSWLAVASAVAHSAAAETNQHQVLGDDSKPTKYHYYPHNQHLYLLPECATQQVCSAVYLRLNYSQPLCACPNFHEPCSVSTRTDDRHTIPLVTGSASPVLTLVKTCEPTHEVRECRAPKDWSILALQNSRTGKAHYLVICRCPSPGYLEGPIAHSQPAYARVPGIRVYGMTCVRSSSRTGRLLDNQLLQGDKDNESSRGTNPSFPWHRLKALLHSAGLIS